MRISDKYHYVVVSLSLMMVYLWSMPKQITLEDAGLFQQVCRYGGVAHPPGYPLFTLLCTPLVNWLPLSPPLPGNLVSALSASLAACVMFALSRRLVDGVGSAYVAALGMGVGGSFWSQATIIEVYSLNAFLVLAMLLALLRFGERQSARDLYLFVLLYALGLANHWPLVAASTPAFIIVLYWRAAAVAGFLRRPRFWLACAALTALGLASYLWLWLRQDAFVRFMPIASVSDFVGYLTREHYRDVDQHLAADWSDKLAYVLWLLRESAGQYGLLMLPVLTLGLVTCWTRFGPVLWCALVALVLGNSVLLALLLGFEYEFLYRAIFRPYSVVAYSAMALWLAAGIAWLVSRMALGRLGRTIVVLVSVAVIFGSNVGDNRRNEPTLAHEYATVVLDSVDEGAMLFVGGDFQLGPIGYLRYMEDYRLDVDVYQQDGLVYNVPMVPYLPSPADQVKQAFELAATAARPVFYLQGLGLPGVDHGLVKRYSRERDGEIAPLPHHEAFVRKLLAQYRAGGYRDPHDRYLAFQLLIRMSGHYIAYGFQHQAPLSGEQEQLILALQDTFMGKLKTFEYLLHNDPRVVDGSLATAMAEEGLQQIPEEAPNEVRAQYHEFAGRIFELHDGEAPSPRAIEYFKRSIELYPVLSNKSVCALAHQYADGARVQEDQTLAAALAHLEHRFDFSAADCVRPAYYESVGEKSAGMEEG